MIERFKKFLQSLFKGSDTGIKQTTQAQEKLKEAAEEFTKKTDLSEVTGKFDETTKPGEFKEQTPIIGPEGETQTKVFSYRPESFTDTQKRTGVGSFSDEALRERYFDEGFDDTMSLEEFIIRERGITPQERAAELRDKGKIQTIEPAPKGATFEEATDEMVLTNQGRMTKAEYETLKAQDENPLLGGITAGKKVKLIEEDTPSLMTAADKVTKLSEEKIQFITNIAKSTGKDPKDVRQLIVDKMNDGYLPRDPKRVTIDDDARIEAYIETQRQMDDMGFVADIIEEAAELPTMGITGNPMLDEMLLSEQKLVREGTEAAQEQIDDAQEKAIGIMEMLKELGINTGSINAEIFKIDIPTGFTAGVRALEKEIKKLEELFERTLPGVKSADPENFTKVLESINQQASADQALAEQLMEDIVMRAQARQITREEGMEELQKVKEKFDKIPEARKEAIKTGVYNSPFGTQGRTLNAKGGRVGFNEGGGPKMGRRGFLQLAGAGLASLFMPRAGKEIAEVVAKGAAKTPITAEGMPIWFPSLVDKIRKEGKMIPADFKATKQGEGYDFYEFTDPSLPNKKIYMTEYKADGTIEISGRGDDMQIAELRFIPGQENIKMGEGKSKVSKDPNMFEADEFMKGPGEGIGDYEGGGTYDDLRFGVESWANLVKAPEQKLKEAAEEFTKKQSNPNPNVSGKNPETGEEFAKGGRVGYNMGGGVQTLFRRKAS
jgi:hypothetical protein